MPNSSFFKTITAPGITEKPKFIIAQSIILLIYNPLNLDPQITQLPAA